VAVRAADVTGHAQLGQELPGRAGPSDIAVADNQGGIMMGIWFWLNIPLMLVFLGCWAGIPAWYCLRRWDAELKTKHAELAATAVPQPVMVRSVPATADYQATASYQTTGGYQTTAG